MLGLDGRLSLESDGDSNHGEALVRTATGWERQATSGGRVDAVATLDCLDGEEQVGALVARGNIVEATAGEALAIGERVMVGDGTYRFVVWTLGNEVVGFANTAASADGDTFDLACGGSVPTTA